MPIRSSRPSNAAGMSSPWIVYILRCGDETLYTGITPDLEARLEAHRSGRGARYTRGRGPFEVVHQETAASKSEATRRELTIKRLPRAAKLALASRKGNRP